MKANTDKQMEDLVSKMMKESKLDKPSNDFTAKIMAQVLDIKLSKATVYEPLISQWVWYAILTAIAALVISLSFNNVQPSSGWFNTYNFELLPKFSFLKLFTSLHFSKTTIYASVLLTLMLFIQIPIIKHIMNRRLEI